MRGNLTSNKNREGMLLIDGKQVPGNFINNICENTPLPEECAKLAPPSLFYFLYSEQGNLKCLSLISSQVDAQTRILDPVDPTQNFKIKSNQSKYKFEVKVEYDKKLDYPNYSVSIDASQTTQFKIASKFSRGEINTTARDMEKNKVLVSLILIFIGLFILNSAGTSFTRFLCWIAGLLFFVLMVFVIFTLFDFQLSGYASTSVIGFLVGASVLIQFLIKKIKQLFNAIISLLTVKIGYTYGGILFPNSPLHERVA